MLEIFYGHAYDHELNLFSTKGHSKSFLEPRAVSFANYLREAYSLKPSRFRYGIIEGDFFQFSKNKYKETISDFKELTKSKSAFSFSYNETLTENLGLFQGKSQTKKKFIVVYT